MSFHIFSVFYLLSVCLSLPLHVPRFLSDFMWFCLFVSVFRCYVSFSTLLSVSFLIFCCPLPSFSLSLSLSLFISAPLSLSIYLSFILSLFACHTVKFDRHTPIQGCTSVDRVVNCNFVCVWFVNHGTHSMVVVITVNLMSNILYILVFTSLFLYSYSITSHP